MAKWVFSFTHSVSHSERVESVCVCGRMLHSFRIFRQGTLEGNLQLEGSRRGREGGGTEPPRCLVMVHKLTDMFADVLFYFQVYSIDFRFHFLYVLRLFFS